MIKLIRSKRNSRGDTSFSGMKTPPRPVFGDFIVTSSPANSSLKSLDSFNDRSLGTPEKTDLSATCSDGEISADREKQDVCDMAQVIVSKGLVTDEGRLGALANAYSLCITGLSDEFFPTTSIYYLFMYYFVILLAD